MGDHTVSDALPEWLAARIEEEYLIFAELQFQDPDHPVIGFELELWILDPSGRPIHRLTRDPATGKLQSFNLVLVGAIGEKRIVVELGEAQIEFNLRPQVLKGKPFTALSEDIDQLMRLVEAQLPEGFTVVGIGSHPLLEATDLIGTTNPRYDLLDLRLWPEEDGTYLVQIPDGHGGTFQFVSRTVKNLVRCTSQQVHLWTKLTEFVDVYNTALAFAAPWMAVSTNAPVLSGLPDGARVLADDIRYWMFEASTNGRANFPGGYAANALDPFRWATDKSILLSPSGTDEAATSAPITVDPRLPHVDTHMGTCWFVPVRGKPQMPNPDSPNDPTLPHIRVEVRPLSAQPTMVDDVSRAAFVIGILVNPEARKLWKQIPIEVAEANFAAACTSSLDAILRWPDPETGELVEIEAQLLIPRLLRLAYQGLLSTGVDQIEAYTVLEATAASCTSKQTGATWLKAAIAHFEDQGYDRQEAIAEAFRWYRKRQKTNEAVGRWPHVSRLIRYCAA